MYVLIPSGETMVIANKKGFKPRVGRKNFEARG